VHKYIHNVTKVMCALYVRCALSVLQKECRKIWGARYTLGARYRSENTVLSLNDGKMSHRKRNISSCREDSLGRQIWIWCSCDCASLLMYSFTYNQQDAMLHNILYYSQCSTCFRQFLRPPSGAQELYTQHLVCASLACCYH